MQRTDKLSKRSTTIATPTDSRLPPHSEQSLKNITDDLVVSPVDLFMVGNPDTGSKPVQSPKVDNSGNLFLNGNRGKGFGSSYLDPKTASSQNTLAPVLQPPQPPFFAILANILLLVVVVLFAIFVRAYLIVILVIFYICYLCVIFRQHSLRSNLQHILSFEEYQQNAKKITTAQTSFKFQIQCYHYENSQEEERKKVVTHKAESNFEIGDTIDQSQIVVKSEVQGKKYVFLQYQRHFYLSDKKSEQRLMKAYNEFVKKNTKDKYQNHRHVMEIQGLPEEVCYVVQGQTKPSMVLYWIFACLGLGGPYLYFMEGNIARYQVSIVKKISLRV